LHFPNCCASLVQARYGVAVQETNLWGDTLMKPMATTRSSGLCSLHKCTFMWGHMTNTFIGHTGDRCTAYKGGTSEMIAHFSRRPPSYTDESGSDCDRCVQPFESHVKGCLPTSSVLCVKHCSATTAWFTSLVKQRWLAQRNPTRFGSLLGLPPHPGWISIPDVLSARTASTHGCQHRPTNTGTRWQYMDREKPGAFVYQNTTRHDECVCAWKAT